MGREQISSGMTVNSHQFFIGLHPFITFFVIEGVDHLCFSFFHNRLSPVTLRIGHVRIIALFSRRLENTHTRFSWAWRWLISSTITRTWRASSFNDLAIRPLLRVLNSHVSGSLLVPGSLDPLSVVSDPGSSFRFLLKLLPNHFAASRSVVCWVPNSCSSGTATQA